MGEVAETMRGPLEFFHVIFHKKIEKMILDFRKKNFLF
jgi:hypothetical protein